MRTFVHDFDIKRKKYIIFEGFRKQIKASLISLETRELKWSTIGTEVLEMIRYKKQQKSNKLV